MYLCFLTQTLSCAVEQLLALREQTESQARDYPSGTCAPSCDGQLSALMEHAIETHARVVLVSSPEWFGDQLVTLMEYT